MREIEDFLHDLLAGTAAEYRDIAARAISVFNSTGTLTERQHVWALRAAKKLKVTVPESFYELGLLPSPVQQAANNLQPARQIPTQPMSMSHQQTNADDALAEVLLEMAALLQHAGERLSLRR
jgi:hypothetical protein